VGHDPTPRAKYATFYVAAKTRSSPGRGGPPHRPCCSNAVTLVSRSPERSRRVIEGSLSLPYSLPARSAFDLILAMSRRLRAKKRIALPTPTEDMA